MAEKSPKITSEVSETRELIKAVEAERRSRGESMVYPGTVNAGDTSVYNSGDTLGGSYTQRAKDGALFTRRGESGVSLETSRPDGGTNNYENTANYELREFQGSGDDSDPNNRRKLEDQVAKLSDKYDYSRGRDVVVKKVDNEGYPVYESKLTGERAERARSILTQRATRNILKKLADKS